MAFRIPSQKRFAPNAKKVVPRKASIPASLAKQPGAGPSGSSGPTSTPVRPTQSSQPPSSLPEPSPTPELTQDDGLPPSIGSTWGGTPTIGSSQPVTQPDTQPSSSFREPSLPPPSRKRAASPTPSNASKSSRTGGRPTMIHLAASSGPARRPTPSPSPAPPAAKPVESTTETPASSSRAGPSPSPVPQGARPSASPLDSSAPLPRVSPSPQRSAPKSNLTAPRPPPKASAPPKKSTPAPAPAPTPTPPVPTSNLPPTISPTRAPSEPAGMPPMVGSSFIDPALLGETAPAPEPPAAGPSRPRTTEEFAQALVAEVAARPGPPKRPPPRLTKQGLLRKKPGPPKGTKSKTAGEPRAPRRKKTPEYDEDGNIIRVPRAPYGSKGKAGTDKDKRTRKNRSEKYLKNSKTGDGDEEGDEVDEFAEDEPIDPSQQKMGSFAKGFYDGDMTERAMKLREAQREKREASKHERTEFERYKRIRTQPLRRRERAKRNEERAQRRKEWEAAGSHEGMDEVSDDEQDSTDEEYEFEPDRLTPPGTPEPENFDGDGGEEQEGVQGEEEIEEGLGDVAEYREDEDEDAEVDDQDWDATNVNLADHGFNVQEDGEEGEEGVEGQAAPAGETEEAGEEDPEFSALFDNAPEGGGEPEYNSDGEPNFSFADYAANMENRRAQALATQNTRFVVTEDDDELRMINSTSWQKRIKTDKWTDDETDHFYSALSEVGENYGLMKAWFPGRSVAQIKKKGLRENAKNPERVTAAILARKPIDDHYLQKSAGYDPDRPWDAEEALFAEAKRDMERLKAEDRGEAPPEYDDMVGEADHDHDHDDFFGHQDEDEQRAEGEVGEEVQGEEAPADEGGDAEVDNTNADEVEQAVPMVEPAEAEQQVHDGALFMPGGDNDDA